DRNGTPLAVSVEVPSVSVDAVELLRGVSDARLAGVLDDASIRIAKVLSLDPQQVRDKLAKRRRFAWLKRRVTAEEVEGIRALGRGVGGPKLSGLVVEGEGHRYFPNRELAGPMLGFVSPGGDGKDGIELALNEQLRGHAEELRGLRDRAGRLIFSEGVKNEKSLAGHNIYLTIDQGIQFVAERELEAAAHTYEAKFGSLVVVNPRTGEILAMASYPACNPNDIGQSSIESRRNRAITDQFEPGSTMKIFTMAAALAHNTISPTQPIFCEDGILPLDNVLIRDTHPAGWLTPTQVLAVSSNIGASKLGLGLGDRRLYEALQRFGFGQPTGIPLPGEASGVLRSRDRPWVPVETASAGFGQGISVTTLQLAMATAAIANRGKLLRPILVKRVTDGTGNVVEEAATEVLRNAVSGTVARVVSEMLVAVTEGEGTGTEAAVPGFRTAGKTATAQKTDPATGKYSTDLYIASFVGFVPAENPRLAVAVVLDEPMISHAGGAVAAPVFRRVSQAALRYLGVSDKGEEGVPMAELGDAVDIAKDTYAYLAPDPPVPAISPVVSANVSDQGARAVVDVTGKPASIALQTLMKQGFVPQMVGSGTVTRQHPTAGTVVPPGTVVQLYLEPPA
ncbi:MAG: transpeptidase family protein, partial [Polyangiaceae bacterium]|nr:transpeptidase family protein [Polyangiaceae bacterium]